MNIRCILVLLFIGIVGCSTNETVSKGSVRHETGVVPSGHGLWYNLPKTVIRVEVVAEKVVAKPGPFFRFSQRLLNVTEVETDNREEWRIVGANISTVGLPDEKRQYCVLTQGSPSIAALNLTKNGVLAGVNMNRYLLRDETAVEPETLISLSDVKFNDVPYTEEQLIKSSTAAMAEEVAKEIYRLRQLRSQILNGSAQTLPPDQGAYKLAIEEINRQEKAFMELFTGKVVVQTVKKNFDFIPQADQSLNTILLRFSQQNGFLDTTDVSGTPVYIEVDVDTKNYRDFISEETSKSINTTGLVYCKPVKAEVKVIDRTLLLKQQEVLLAQFGQLLRMPADLFNVNGAGVEMDVTTGAVKRVFYK